MKNAIDLSKRLVYNFYVKHYLEEEEDIAKKIG